MAEKTKEERLKEGVHLLLQLKGTGVDPELSYKQVKAQVDDWIKTGDPWSGKIQFPECNRVAEIVLPRKAVNTATLLLRVKK
jgi:hypothetical protein